MVSNISLQNKAPGLPGQQRKSGLGATDTPGGPATTDRARKGVYKKKKKPHTHNDGGMSERHRSPRKELPMAKAENNLLTD